MKWPEAVDNECKSGWRIDFNFLRKVKQLAECDVCEEDVEEILLAADRVLEKEPT